MSIVLALVFALVGGMWAHWTGLFFGGLLGWLLGAVLEQRARIEEIARRVERLQSGQHTDEPPRAPRPAAAGPATAPATPDPVEASDTRSAGMTPAQPAAPAPHRAAPRPPASPSASARFIDGALDWLKRFVTGGNPVVRIGVVVLFIGVAFLLRYAAERVTFPIELRLASVAAGAIVGLLIGWRLRHRPDGYGVILQGAAVGVLYLTVFAAARLYDVVPLEAAFALLVLVVLFSTTLALLQNAQVLAVFALAGGFLAPVLMSTGTGSHVALFSYYALLNAGVLAMAWFRAWRMVNWVGFMFTFVIGTSWGYHYYEPEHFASTQPFLVLFFLYYVAVGTLFTRPRAQAGAGMAAMLDGTMVFGTPIVAFALQAALVSDREFGLAYSALFVAAVYVGLTAWLRRRHAFDSMLGQSYLALGIVFASLAIPFAFDDQRWTGAAWALEGAGLVWVGLRQQRLLPRLLGLALQVAAGLAFLSMAGRAAEPRLLLNSVYMGCVMLSLAGLFSALQFHRHEAGVRVFERRFAAPVLLGWGLAWWFAGGLREAVAHVADRFALEALAGYVAVSFAGLTLAAIRLAWPAAARPSVLSIPLVGMLVLIGITLSGMAVGDPIADAGWLVWPLAIILIWHGLHRAEQHEVWGHRMLSAAHAAALAVLTLLLCWILDAGVEALAGDVLSRNWHEAMWGAVPAALIVVLPRLRRRLPWPVATYAEAYGGLGILPVAALLVAWLMAAGTVAADPAPLPYVPLVNPVELVQLAGLLALGDWVARQRTLGLVRFVSPLRLTVAALAFFWLNTVAARAVHYLGGVPYPLGAIAESAAFQATISILWTLIALAAMAWGSQRATRRVWIGGACLLAVVTVKLFVVDLSGIGTVARIVSFLSVGGLMLVIGFLAPLPPKDEGEPAGTVEGV